MTLNLNDAAVQAALISTAGSIAAAIIAAICAALIGHQIANRKKLETNLVIAMRDIEFLLTVEQHHCQHHQDEIGQSLKNTMRTRARDEGAIWSGQNTPSRNARRALSFGTTVS